MNHEKYPIPAHSPLRAILPFCLALLFIAVASPASQVYRYREQTRDASFTFAWCADRNQDSVTVTQYQRNGIFRSVNTMEGATISWQYVQHPDTDIRVERHGDHLRFSGLFAGKLIDRSQVIDNRPWYQSLTFCLQQMVAREQQAADFWTIRPDTLDVLAMQAEKTDQEQIPDDKDGFATADKVIIHPAGLLSPLWQAEYWFRPDDNRFLRYRGTHGLPGTAETLICLITH